MFQAGPFFDASAFRVSWGNGASGKSQPLRFADRLSELAPVLLLLLYHGAYVEFPIRYHNFLPDADDILHQLEQEHEGEGHKA